MKCFHRTVFIFLLQLLLGSVAASAAADAKAVPVEPGLRFSGTEYLHRWSTDNQREYTPRGQEDLAKWNEMITLVYYRTVKDGEGLAAMANSVLEIYKSNRAVVAKTSSVPRTATKPAEYLIVVLLPQPDVIEAVFARLKMTAGIGSAIIFSHREYGTSAGNAMSAWLQKNGPIIEPAIMSWDEMPAVDSMKK